MAADDITQGRIAAQTRDVLPLGTKTNIIVLNGSSDMAFFQSTQQCSVPVVVDKRGLDLQVHSVSL